jgi:hypothetical protein
MTRLALCVGLLLLPGMARALSVDEIIKLKQAGVADSTIELLIEKDADRAKSAGIVRHNGWIVHTTETREPQRWFTDNDGSAYPIVAYPWVSIRRR